MRRILAVAALTLGACVSPAEENVSLEGPTRTSGETTTTEEPAETTTTAPQQPVEVGRWSGTAETDTPNFTVKESWELHWKISESGGFGIGIEWNDPADQFSGGLLQVDEVEGSSLIREGGTFYLHISMYGSDSWEVWAVDVPN